MTIAAAATEVQALSITALMFVVTVCFLAVPPADAQSTATVYRVGILSGGPSTSKPIEAFRQGLRELGWIEGQNIVIEHRFAEGNSERLPGFAADLVRLKVDVIAAGPTPPVVAARNATGTIPIVMLGAAEPVELGLIASLARPGGNITGLSWSVNLEIIGKGLQILKEALPKVRHVAILWNSSNPAQAIAIKDVKASARLAGVQLLLLDVRGPDEFERAFATMAKQRVDAVLVVADALFVSHRARIAELEARYRLPSMHGLLQNVDAGGLMFYGPDLTVVYRRGAFYVDKILKGTKPADLPVEQPAKYDLVINLKTAKALGLAIPQSLLFRADQIIE
jgi:putative ABC transport system substrate-binding protein